MNVFNVQGTTEKLNEIKKRFPFAEIEIFTSTDWNFSLYDFETDDFTSVCEQLSVDYQMV